MIAFIPLWNHLRPALHARESKVSERELLRTEGRRYRTAVYREVALWTQTNASFTIAETDYVATFVWEVISCAIAHSGEPAGKSARSATACGRWAALAGPAPTMPSLCAACIAL